MQACNSDRVLGKRKTKVCKRNGASYRQKKHNNNTNDSVIISNKI